MRAPKPLQMPEAAKSGEGTSAAGSTPDVMAEFRKLLNETVTAAGGGAALTDRETKLLRENYKMRDRLREANGQLDEAKKKVVAEGATVLTGDDATEYAAFKKLGLAVKDLTPKLAEHATLVQEKAAREAEAQLDGVAETLGIANVRAFKRLVAAEGLTVSLKTVKVKDEETGKMVDEQVPVVRKRGAADSTEPEALADVLERDYVEDLPTLLATSVGDAVDTGEVADRERPARSLGASTRTTTGAGNGVQDDAASGGTRFPRLSGVAPTGAGQSRKREQDLVTAKAATGRYAL